jgi:hypothetical protein
LAAITVMLPLEPLSAQAAEDDQEVYLTFRYQNLVNIYIISTYRDGDFFMPQSELFRNLNVDARIDYAANSVTGEFMDIGTYVIDLDNLRATLADREIDLTADDFIISELDIFLHPDIFQDLFDFDFSVDFNNLRLYLDTPHTLPIETRQERERQRRNALRSRTDPFTGFYDLRYDRQRQNFNGGFLDYNLSANFTEGNNSYLYNTGIGMEVLGGDLQGHIFGNWSRQSSSLRSNNLRWQYALENESLLTQITAGQTVSNGLVRSAFSGVKITNEPIQPRFLFDDYAFSGTTIPESEVELYRNNVLIDYQTADEVGEYRFRIPLTYGTSQYDIRMYSPTGQVSQRLTRMQVPFNFVPPGEINYTFEAGRLDNPIPGTPDRGFMTQGHVRSGINNWLTAGGGVEYYENFHGDGLPTFSTFLSGRIQDNYILSMEAATEAFVRVNAGAIYPSSASVDFSYTHFNRKGGLYNPARNLNNFRFNLFTPFQIGNLPLFFRTSLNRDKREQTETYRYSFNLNTRINRFSIRMGYRDTQLGSPQFTSTSLSRISTTVTYTIPRRQNIPNLLRGVFVRSRTTYAPARGEFEDLEFQLSRNVMQGGRLQLTAGHNFIGGFNFVNANLSIDFSSFRSNSVTRSARNRTSMTQNVRGSIGYDSGNDRFVLNNRQHVGRSGAAVRMFVDHTNSGTYEEGDQLIEDPAIRIDRAGSSMSMKDGITYLTQLQPYQQYNMSVNKNAIRNPLLVPLVENFSFISDPNQFKIIDIPLYMSGIIDGTVLRTRQESEEGVAGLRLILEQTDTPEGNIPFTQELRTFSDGSFYAYEIHPGSYILRVDPTQLELLNVVSVPEKLEFDIERLPDGDYVDQLNFKLIPKESAPVETEREILAQAPEEGDPAPAFTELLFLPVDSLVQEQEQMQVQNQDQGQMEQVPDHEQDLEQEEMPKQEQDLGQAQELEQEPVKELRQAGDLELDLEEEPGLDYVQVPEQEHELDQDRKEEQVPAQEQDPVNRHFSQFCKHSVQLGSYHSFETSINVAGRAAHEFDADVYIYANELTSMYGLYINNFKVLSDAMEKLKSLKQRNSEHQYTILSDCSATDESKKHGIAPLDLEIKLGTFPNKRDAENFVHAAINDHGVGFQIREGQTDDTFIIMKGPYHTPSDALQALVELPAFELAENPSITYKPETSIVKSFTFKLLLTRHIESEQAELINGCTDRFGVPCTIYTEEQSSNDYLMIGESFRSWFAYMDHYREVVSQAGEEDLVIYILNE